MNGFQIPLPRSVAGVEQQEALLAQCGQELNREKRITKCFLVHEQRQGLGGCRRSATERIGDEFDHVAERQRPEQDVAHDRPALANRIQRPHKGVSGTHLVIAESANQQQVPDVSLGHEVFEKFERSQVGPLQVVQEEGQRMLLAGESGQKRPEHGPKTVFGFHLRNFHNRRLLADYQLQFGDQADDQLSI